MYRIQAVAADTWSIRDEQDAEVYSGTLADCESWLDAQENQSTGAVSESTFRLRDWIRQAIQQLNASPRETSATGTPAAETSPPKSS